MSRSRGLGLRLWSRCLSAEAALCLEDTLMPRREVSFKNAVAAGGRILNAPYPAARESSGIYRSADHAVHNVAQYTARLGAISIFRPLVPRTTSIACSTASANTATDSQTCLRKFSRRREVSHKVAVIPSGYYIGNPRVQFHLNRRFPAGKILSGTTSEKPFPD